MGLVEVDWSGCCFCSCCYYGYEPTVTNGVAVAVFVAMSGVAMPTVSDSRANITV